MPTRAITTTQRDVGLDLLRVGGVVAVVAGHLLAGPDTMHPNVFRILLYSWHVPLFFFISGYLWNRERSLGRELRVRTRSLAVPYIAWTLILGLVFGIVDHLSAQQSIDDPVDVLWGGMRSPAAFAAFWFVPVLFFVALALRSLERMPRFFAWGVAGVGLVGFYLVPSILNQSPLDVVVTVPCLLFALAGQELRRVQTGIRHPLVTSACLLLASSVLLLSRVAAPLDIKPGDFGTPLLSPVVSIAICSALVLAARNLRMPRSTWFTSIVQELATTSTAVLFLHFALMFRVATQFGIRTPLLFAIGVSIPWCIGIVLHRTSLSPWLLGVPRAQVDPTKVS